MTVLTVLFFVALIGAFSTGFWLVSRLANLIVVGVPIAYLWAWLNLRGLEVAVERPVDRLQEGNDFEERITVVNHGWFTKLWLEVEDLSDLPGHRARRVIGLGPHARRSWRTVSPCTRRGLYTIGPVRVTTGDLFGLFRRSRTFGEAQHVLVYPRAVELPKFFVPPALLPGEGRFRRPSHYVTPNAAGVREYQPGDSFNRIHWRSTARTGELMVKLFELDPASDVWVVLDLHRAAQSGEGDDGTEEHAVRIAASVARFFLLANRSVGFLAHGRRFHLEEPERGLSQYTRILEELALARAEGDTPLAEVLNHEGRRFGRHTTVVAVTPSTDESWVVSLQMLAGRGVKLAAILLEPRTFGGQGNALFVFGALAAADIFTYLVKRSDDLTATLGSGAEAALPGKGRR
ncbi:MAG: hypothetical protein A2148_00125 [Chloroflexi bacterium RBG_16_68_14]|nr:MAG: hypothetical protein A2148_00125 [Chloroflexi bacterium RBG_16_68_14]